MIDHEILIEKYDLVCSKEYERIKKYQLEHIVKLANSDIDPLILKGMLKVIADSDKWENEFLQQKNKKNKKKR